MKIVALAGGVGGAKLAHGLTKVLSPEELTVIVNTGDDFEHFGLHISPDLDTVCYTLAEINNPTTGWGRNEETFNVLATIRELGGPTWFQLGDKDIALHLERKRRLDNGQSLSDTTQEIAKTLGIKHQILPMSNEKVSTIVDTVEHGEIPFQEYFVHKQFEPTAKGFRFQGIENAKPTDEVLEAIKFADAIVICPSNPFVSINPIISLNEIAKLVKEKYTVLVSPIIGGKAVKGPLGKMLHELGHEVSPISILQIYNGLIDCFYIDRSDYNENYEKIASGIIIEAEDILLPNIDKRRKLALKIIRNIEKNI